MYSTAQLNGFGAAVFDGNDDSLANNTDYAFGGFTVFVVAKPTSTHEIDIETNNGTAGVSGQKYLIYPTQEASDGGTGISMGSNGISVYEHGNGYLPPLAVGTGSFLTPTVVTVSYANNAPTIYSNGILLRAGQTSGATNSRAPKFLGATSFPSFQGQVFELVIFARTLNATERGNIETYLKSKFGL